MEHLYCLCGHGQPGAKSGLGPFVERRLEDNEAICMVLIWSKASLVQIIVSLPTKFLSWFLIPVPSPRNAQCVILKPIHLRACLSNLVYSSSRSPSLNMFSFFSFCLPFLSLFQSFSIFVFLYFVFLLSQGCVYQQMDAVCKMLRHLRGVKEGETGKGRMILPACTLAQSSY